MTAVVDHKEPSINLGDEEPMEYLLSPIKDEMFVDLTAILVSSTPSSAFTSAPPPREALERQVQLLTFERDQTQTLMLTALSSRDSVHLEWDIAWDTRDATIIESTALRSFIDEIIDQTRELVDH